VLPGGAGRAGVGDLGADGHLAGVVRLFELVGQVLHLILVLPRQKVGCFHEISLGGGLPA
jgi:hypothetical protein